MKNGTKYDRVCLYGGPGSGKSTMALYLAYRLKADRREVEIAREWCKRAAYGQGRPSQAEILRNQHAEEMAARATGAVVVCESPLWMQLAYTDDTALAARVQKLARHADQCTNTLNVLLVRGDRPFVQAGRWHNEDEARDLDRRIERVLRRNGVPYVTHPTDDRDGLYAMVVGRDRGRKPEPEPCDCYYCTATR